MSRAQETYLSKKARDMDDAQKQWGKWLKKAEAGGRVNEETLDKAVRTRVGVPHELRSRVWPLLCGALAKGAAPSPHARTRRLCAPRLLGTHVEPETSTATHTIRCGPHCQPNTKSTRGHVAGFRSPISKILREAKGPT